MRFRLLVTAFLIAAALRAPGTAQARTYLVSKIEFTGLQRLTQPQAIELAGLSTKERIDPAAIDTLAKRVSETGFFQKVAARYRADGEQLTLIFDVEEAEWSVPVVFDNFIGFSSKELIEAVRRRLSSFDGSAPKSQAVCTRIERTLQQTLEARGIQGKVRYLLDGDALRHVFHVEGPVAPVCALRFPGASAIPEAGLEAALQVLLAQDFSRLRIEKLENDELAPRYRDLGRYRVRFGEPVLRASEAPGCAGFVVTIPVEEGAPHLWTGSSWSGNAALEAKELDTLLGMTPGDLASEGRIEAGLHTVSAAYQQRGFLDVALEPQPILAEGQAAVSYRIAVREGASYRMGKLTIEGLYARDLLTYLGRFKLAPGDVYDAIYVADFVDDFLADAKKLRPGRVPSSAVRADPTSLTVDVELSVLPPGGP